MKTLLMPLLPVTMMAASSAGISAQDALPLAPPSGRSLLVLTADPTQPAPKSAPKPPQQFRVTPAPPRASSQKPPLLQLPRFTTPVIQHDLSQYPMPVTAGKGHPVRIPTATPRAPFDNGKTR